MVTIEKGTTGNLEYTANWALYGDVNMDGEIDVGDSSCLSRYIVGDEVNTSTALINLIGDVNLDNEIDDVDVKIIQKYLAREFTKLPYDSGEKYTITYDLNGGEIKEDRNIEKYADISLDYHLYNPTKEGYTFIGWTGSNGDTPQKEVNFKKLEGHLHYIANWELNN